MDPDNTVNSIESDSIFKTIDIDKDMSINLSEFKKFFTLDFLKLNDKISPLMSSISSEERKKKSNKESKKKHRSRSRSQDKKKSKKSKSHKKHRDQRSRTRSLSPKQDMQTDRKQFKPWEKTEEELKQKAELEAKYGKQKQVKKQHEPVSYPGVSTFNPVMIEIQVNDRLGKKERIKCRTDDKIGDIKKLVAAKTGIRPDKIKLQKWHQVYKDHITLEDYEIKDGMNLEMYYN
ncbi:hypothetical protein PPERSA_05681 [Pseudocohnilembus persalinus]|uniref:Ubiquitin-like domain-containing protein n=1 Tax=Pseudocohnilembus persalinus TaxID=266149 RepID=A0A0V0QM37_PSEPJ|nr:hypothetical protein PPERSA_05681 [Pseudocohnilembus persalinus]|eukprot:KRX03323.1 hypothetical protein PPERSA_05681 [Pseudocohnilembus persalinus]